MAELEAGEFAVSKQGETMHVIGKVAVLIGIAPTEGVP